MWDSETTFDQAGVARSSNGKGLGSLTNYFCPANLDKFILHGASTFCNGFKM